MAINTNDLIDALECADFEYRSYSGRAMFGKECLGVDLDSEGDLWRLATELAQAGLDIPAPRTDSMGRGIIAYWPTVEWSA